MTNNPASIEWFVSVYGGAATPIDFAEVFRTYDDDTLVVVPEAALEVFKGFQLIYGREVSNIRLWKPKQPKFMVDAGDMGTVIYPYSLADIHTRKNLAAMLEFRW